MVDLSYHLITLKKAKSNRKFIIYLQKKMKLEASFLKKLKAFFRLQPPHHPKPLEILRVTDPISSNAFSVLNFNRIRIVFVT